MEQNEPVECLRVKAAKGESSNGKRRGYAGRNISGVFSPWQHPHTDYFLQLNWRCNLWAPGSVSSHPSVLGLAIPSLCWSPEKCWRQRNTVFIVAVLPRLPFRYWLKYFLAKQILVRLTQPLLETKIYEAYYWEGSGWVRRLVWIMYLLAMSLVFQN